MSPESEEKMHGAGRDEKVVMIPDGEEEADSIREAIVTSVETQEVECLHLAPKAR